MNYLYLVLFFVITILHLYASHKNDYTFRSATKGMILLTLLGFYLESVEQPSWLVIIAILTSWLGDELLIPHGVKWFTIGGISFEFSHLFFIAAYISLTDFSKVPVIAFVLFGLFFATVVTLIFQKLTKHLPKALVIPMYTYLLVNGADSCFAWFRFLSHPSLGAVLTAIGAMMFFVSDSSLFFVRFSKETKQKSHFLVMFTYSFGEFLMILGLILG